MSIARSYDVLVIGSGLGGLTTAAFANRYGKKVLLVERHNVGGGFAHSFSRRGFEWDVGVHYVGQVGRPENHLRKMFDYLSDGALEWADMGEIYDRVVIGDRTFDFYAGAEKQMERMIEYFPDEEKAIRRYYERIREFPLSSGFFFGERAMPRWLALICAWPMRRGFLKRARRTTHEVLRELTNNDLLIAVLCAQCGGYGLPPRQSSFAVHAGVVEHYLKGGFYPVGGARSIYETLARAFTKRGGQIELKKEVAEVLVAEGRAVGVRLRDGEEILARKIVSSVGARNSFLKLWPKAIPLPRKIRQGLARIRPSVAHVCLYVGLDASDAELNLPKNNFWIYPNADFDTEFERLRHSPSTNPLLAYISFPSAKDPSWPARKPGKSTIQVIAPCPYEWVEAWENSTWLKRAEDYKKFKEAWRDSLLEKLYQVVPQARGHMAHCEVSTPLSTKHFGNYECGEIYGLEHTPLRMQADWLRAHTPLKGFYLTGQDIVMVGLCGALFSGAITAVAVLRRNVLWPIFAPSVMQVRHVEKVGLPPRALAD